MSHFRCASCNDQMSVTDSQAGQSEKCPNCGNVAVVPTGAPAASNATLNVKLPDKKPTSFLGVVALVMGILAALTCWIPILGLAVSAVGLLFAFIGLLTAIIGKKSIGMPIAGGIVCGIAIAIAISVTGALLKALTNMTSLATT